MNDPRQKARALLEMSVITLDRLWISYWAQGGNATPFEFEAYVYGVLKPPPFDLQIINWAIEDLGRDHRRGGL